jgi:hypothetical protein
MACGKIGFATNLRKINGLGLIRQHALESHFPAPCLVPHPLLERQPTMPRLSKLSPAEREVLIAKTAEDTEWTIYITDPAELPYYLGLSKKVGGRVVEHQGEHKIFIPQDSVLLQVRRKLNLSPEQRQERATQMKARRAGQSVTANTSA